MAKQKELINEEEFEEKIIETPIVKEMQTSYLDYAMSVIVNRALPDARDGLKPVHRRILVTLRDLGLSPGGRYRKSAKICGDVSGNYHPHGEAIVYPSMVRLAQEFSYRYPLVKGQGNFGSMDGDPPAAMRYTEAKMTPFAEEMLKDLEKDTVDWRENYDATRKEPVVLPSKLPNLLLNGTVGIAVGMASNIPPHNLVEVCNALEYLIDNAECSIDDLLNFIKGPDFPTGGILYNENDIKEAYSTGKGGIVLRGKAEIIEAKNGQFMILITEVPYQMNKADFLEKIAELVKTKKIEGIKDIRDESSEREGVRAVVELKKEAYPNKVLNQLYNLTPLQQKYHVNMLALVDGIQPRILNLKMILEEFVKHRKIVVTRRTQYELDKARERAHILEGLVLALANIDAVIKTIKKSKDKESAKFNLIKEFKLSERQSIAILEMKLQQLANLERTRIEQELKDKKKLIKELMAILESEKKIFEIIKSDLKYLKDKFGDDRRTKIIKHAVDQFKPEDLIPNEEAIVILTKDGYIKRIEPSIFKSQGRGGKGVMGLTTKEQDIVHQIFTMKTHDKLLFFTTKGRVFQLYGYDIPQSSRTAKGQALVNFLQMASNEKVTRILPVNDIADQKYLVMATKKGLVKKVNINDFEKVRKSGLIAIKLRPDDSLEWVKTSSGKDEIIIVTALGNAIRFKETDVRPMGRTASGVRGIRLKNEDRLVGMDVVTENKLDYQLMIITEKGFGKKTGIKFYRIQKRGGSGIKTLKMTEKTGKIVSALFLPKKDPNIDLLIISDRGQTIRLAYSSVKSTGRVTMGVRLMRFKKTNDKVASVAVVAKGDVNPQLDLGV
jgi:DNA gyrase subunit A